MGFNLVVAVVVGHIDFNQVLQDMGFEQQLVNHNLAELEVDHIVADAAAAVAVVVVVVDTTLAYTAVEIDHMDFELEADHIADSELELDHIVVVATAIREEVLGHLVDHCFD